ncbi:MAG TPA: 2TM domain-containing protein [Eudoraea sp.]|nr:2TM domain-containing protein [Eudoraea sp.]
METEEAYLEKLRRAKKRVGEIKGFYNHVKAFVIVNIVLFLIRADVFKFITAEGISEDVHFMDWLSLNFLITPVLWGIGLVIHAIYVHRHRFKFIGDWEEKQIQRYMEQEEEEGKTFWD